MMPMDFSRRSDQKELLDRDDIPFGDIRRNMQELDFINTWLGGHAISIQGLKTLLDNYKPDPGKPIRICEIGCGGGDNLRALHRWCLDKQIKATVIGIDLNPHCIAVAEEKWPGENARWICSDYRRISFDDSEENKPDIIFSSLFCHHFRDEELVSMLQWMDHSSKIGWFINDLHRHRMAWQSIRLLTALFSRSYLVKNDAPLSVLRGFKRREWEQILETAAIDNYSLRWKWAFRWLTTRSKP